VFRARASGWPIVGALCVALGSVASAQPAPPAPPVPPVPPAGEGSATETPPPPAPPPTTPPETPAAPTPPPPLTPPEPVAAPVVVTQVAVRKVDLHGFVSQGAFVSTANDYIGASSRGSLGLFEVGLNASTQVAKDLRAGIQLFARDLAVEDELVPRVDWAFLDYRWRRWLGVRAGIIKMPYGLYNEYVDIDAARTAILMPQSVYPIRNREALISHRGFSVYGEHEVGGAGSFDYQAFLGTLTIPKNALTLSGADLDRTDTKYVTGGQVFWRPPVEGLRLGVSYVRASVDFYLHLPAATVSQLVMAGLVPATFDGGVVVSQRPTSFVVGSAEYVHGPWLFAAEYQRTDKRQRTSIPTLIPTYEQANDGLYVLATYQATPRIQTGAYYSLNYVDADDRRGHDPKYTENFQAFQRDLGATVRFDVNDHWLWKLEGHFIDGAADLNATENPMPTRYWGLLLLRTTVTF
jgi:hypothetical protein